MAEKDGSVNPFLRLSMRLLSQNLDVLSSSINLLFTAGRAWSTIGRDLRLQVLEEDELSIEADHKESISKMARTPYVTVRGAEPVPAPSPLPKETKMAYEDPQPEAETGVAVEAIVLADADRVEKLLDIIMNTVGMPNIPCIRQAASNELGQIEADLRAQMYPDIVAAEIKAEEERIKAEKEAQKRIKERQAKEREPA